MGCEQSFLMHWEALFTSYGTDNCREAAVG
jgi:hypothetical protein